MCNVYGIHYIGFMYKTHMHGLSKFNCKLLGSVFSVNFLLTFFCKPKYLYYIAGNFIL